MLFWQSAVVRDLKACPAGGSPQVVALQRV